MEKGFEGIESKFDHEFYHNTFIAFSNLFGISHYEYHSKTKTKKIFKVSSNHILLILERIVISIKYKINMKQLGENSLPRNLKERLSSDAGQLSVFIILELVFHCDRD